MADSEIPWLDSLLHNSPYLDRLSTVCSCCAVAPASWGVLGTVDGRSGSNLPLPKMGKLWTDCILRLNFVIFITVVENS